MDGVLLLWWWQEDFPDVGFLSGPHAQVKAEEGAVENGIDAPKIEENIGGVPSGLTTDSEVVQRY